MVCWVLLTSARSSGQNGSLLGQNAGKQIRIDFQMPVSRVDVLTGGNWPDLARKAAVALVAPAVSNTPESLNIRLLSDLRTVFAANDAAVQATTPKGIPPS